MVTKTVASLGLAAAATAGALLFTGSPASAQTTPVSATNVAYVQTSAHHSSHDWEHGRHHHHGWDHRWHHHHHGWHHNVSIHW